MVCAPGGDQTVVGFLRFMRSTRQAWPILSFDALPEGSPTLACAKTRARRVRVRPGGAENVIPLSDGHPAYCEGLGGKILRELRRRERKTDILQLADFFVEKYNTANGKSIERISMPVNWVLPSESWAPAAACETATSATSADGKWIPTRRRVLS